MTLWKFLCLSVVALCSFSSHVRGADVAKDHALAGIGPIVRYVLDMGSSSVKIYGCEIDPRRDIVVKYIFSMEERISLQGGIKDRQLPRSAQDEAVAVIRHFLAKAAVDPTKTKVIGIATAWARAADNSGELLERIERETGVVIRTIDQDTEAEIGIKSVLAELRSLVFNRESYLYHANDGREVLSKVVDVRSAHVMSSHVVAWDIGGGSMQMSHAADDGSAVSYGSEAGSTPFADAVIAYKKREYGHVANTPNPLSAAQMRFAVELGMTNAEQLIAPHHRAALKLWSKVVLGIGLMHKSVRLYVNSVLGLQSEHSYTRVNLKKATRLLLNKDDAEIALALDIKVAAHARNRLTSMLMVLGFMTRYQIDKVYTMQAPGVIGAFFMDSF